MLGNFKITNMMVTGKAPNFLRAWEIGNKLVLAQDAKADYEDDEFAYNLITNLINFHNDTVHASWARTGSKSGRTAESKNW